jgi:hypothetical protein
VNKDTLKENLTTEDIFKLVDSLGGQPDYTPFGLICQTICHNLPNEGSKKLYYYNNTRLFRCYTGCQETFDIFELIIKASYIQFNQEISLMKAMHIVLNKLDLKDTLDFHSEREEDDWDYINSCFDTQNISLLQKSAELPIFNKDILKNFLYPIIDPWENESISRDVIKNNLIGYFPPTDQITIPHFDIDGQLVGIRGRFLVKQDAERYGKYRPLCINKVWYSHPLGLNLYNLNNSKNVIKQTKTAIIYEGEKSCLLHQTYFGKDMDFSVACCGSSISDTHIQLLKHCGAEEIIIAFDKQFQEIDDAEFEHLTKNLTKIYNKYSNLVKISIIFDKEQITPYKSSPIDNGKEIFLTLFNNRLQHL